MKTNILFFVFMITSSSDYCQLNKFGDAGSFEDIHSVYEYRKSNWNGTHAS